ncbi:biotin synthase [Geotalea daltonii FRC-32]|uniref:Biotin synthase n=1 Tax=Geotalea daltonii (strain DSM 22248 / JCM 15807 / FRC-32) TaxID=316067 RepID=BIOB_GEODF|nr:biotin synthase BioB [Geotalea daltonii]B9M305.1 RecName: Full=Biotin synthase [Geotalea daltonii FRC-32]ACM21351.1 biotin synthase [Geotalea daltonii FRC-32]
MKMNLEKLGERIIEGGDILVEEALELANLRGSALYPLFGAASRIKEHFVGDKVFLCSIVNAKSGRCPENCSFCAQSAHHKTDAPVYSLIDEERMVACAREAEKNGSSCYGIITSGTSIKKGEELERICNAVRRIRRETGITPSCSLGIINHETASALVEAGVETYHHNLETSRSFFPNVCTTHDYEEDVNTVRVAKKAGLKVCCGGIFGLGESVAQRIEMAYTLRELDVDSVPLNFLNPIAGTKLENAENITPMECLQTIALFRLILPTKRISICGGREKNLRDLQSWIFFAGASGTMIGNYLTTTGRAAEEDWQMLKDLNLSVASCCE